ncbi:SDH family Clp fold serine proteinase [Anaerobaca lacustris]|uniref:Uncharacterized protein n=1 Tax=Anaerobaca lacustris TaxID=3044600 RepID=A0AAW6TUB2_9BACT|nr:hypothetical protein [Sedimentisphaerales bacterium M17dextr]
MARKKAVKKVSGKAPSPKKRKAEFYSSSPYAGVAFCQCIQELEEATKLPVVLLCHGGDAKDPYAYFNDLTYEVFARNIRRLERGKPVQVVIDSPGGDARCAYKLASLLRKHCGHFFAVVPHYAKSAATLFALGADTIVMSRFAELGPLDVQIEYTDKEERFSGLEVVQAVERLNGEAMRALDQQMVFWLMRSRKKLDTLLPVVTHFVSEMMRPLFERIDTVNYTAMARALKVAQDYAERLLEATGLGTKQAKEIAERLTTAYSEHGYVLDCEELNRIGMGNVQEATGEAGSILERLAFLERGSTMLGPLKEV